MSRIKERRGPTDCSDIAPRFVIFKALRLTLIVALILAGLVWLVYFIADKPEVTQEKNQKIETFNALPKEERQLLKDFTSNLDWQDEDDTMLELEATLSLQDVLAVQKGLLVIDAIVMFIALFCYYWWESDDRFFLVDFPLGKVYGWILLILCLPFGWPFLCVSRIRMWRYFRKKETQDETTDSVTEAELDQNEAVEEIADMTDEETEVADEEAYVALRMEFAKERSEHTLRNLDVAINRAKEEIQNHGQRIQSLQQELGRLRTERSRLEACTEDGEIMTRQVAISELKKIRKMRGVKKITPDLEDGSLEILIQVRVVYLGAQYDFGDYLVKFWSDSHTTRLLRSGVKENADSRGPFYPDGDGFCFGNRKNEIESYVEEGRIVEALTLIVDCMHSVNEGDEEDIPDCFRRISNPKSHKKGGKK